MIKMIMILFIIPITAMAVCSSTISRTNSGTNTVLTSTKYNADLNVVYARANELPGDCVTNETITTTQILDGTIATSDLETATFGAIFDGLRDGCRVTKTDANTISVGKCRLGVNGNLVNTATASTVTWGCSGCSSEASDTLYYVYAKTGSTGTTLNLQLTTTAPTEDGYDVSSNRVLGKIYNDGSSDLSDAIRSYNSAFFANDVNVFTCSLTTGGSVAIKSQSVGKCAQWIASTSGTTTAALTIESGIFAEIPVCVCTTLTGQDEFCQATTVSTSSVEIQANQAGSANASELHVMCAGAKQ